MVWERFGNVDVYAEPFMGSGAVLLRRPLEHFDPKHGARSENVTDLNFYISNFFRAVQRDPESVARWCDFPVSEIDLHARHRYLTRGPDADKFKAAMIADPDYFDARFAGWWCWGMNLWIGGAWCHDAFVERSSSPYLDTRARGTHSKHHADLNQRPMIDQPGRRTTAEHSKRPMLDKAGNSTSGSAKPRAEVSKLPHLDSAGGRGVASTSEGPRPQLADAYDIGRGTSANFRAGTCAARRAWLTDWMQRLSDRLCRTRVMYGHWKGTYILDASEHGLNT